MSTNLESLDLNGLTVSTININEANQNSLNQNQNNPTDGLYIIPSLDVPGRGDITGYVLQSSNEFGKLQWVDPTILPNLSAKESVRVASTADVDLNNTVSIIDGINLNTNDRVLIKNQVDTTENGIYTLDASGFLQRSFDAETGMISFGTFTIVVEGVTNARTLWVCITYDSEFGDTIVYQELIYSSSAPGAPLNSIQYNNGGSFGGITNITTNGTNELIFLDNSEAQFGTGIDLTIVHDGTDNIFTSSTGDLLFDNTNIAGQTIFQLGSDTNTTLLDIINNSGLSIGTFYGNQESTFAGDVTIQAETTHVTTVSTITTAGDETYTAAQMQGGIILRDPNGASRNDTTDTAANIVAGVHDAIVGSSYTFVVENTSGAAEIITLGAGVGVTLDPNGVFTIDENQSRSFKVVFTNITPTTEAVTIYSLSLGGSAGGGTPGGANTTLQYNNAGSFGGISDVTTNGTSTMNFADDALAQFGGSNQLQLLFDAAGGNISTIRNVGTDFFLIDNASTAAMILSSTGSNLSIIGQSSNGIQFSATNLLIEATTDITIDSIGVTESIINRLGTDTNATDFQIQNNSTAILFEVDGAGTTQINTATNSTSSTSGVLQIAGGVGIALDTWTTGDINLDADNTVLTIGDGQDLSITHNGTNTIATSITGDFIIDNTNITGSTIIQLGTDTNATDFQIQNNSTNTAMTVYGTRQSTFAGDVTIQAETTHVTTVSTITTAGDETYTAAQMQGGIILRDPNGAARNDTTDTAANIVAGVHDAVVGSSYTFIVENTSGADETITLQAGVGVTLDPNGVFTITRDQTREFKVIFTNVGGGTEAVAVYSINVGGAGGSPGGANTTVQYNNAGVFGGISDVTTNGTTTMNWTDSASAIWGTGNDLTITHNGTNSLISNTTGNLSVSTTTDNLQLTSSNATGATQILLGTDTAATSMQVNNLSNDTVFKVDGAGRVLQDNTKSLPIELSVLTDPTNLGDTFQIIPNGDIAYVISQLTIVSVDISDPTSIVVLDTVAPAGAAVMGLAGSVLIGEYLFTCDFGGGADIYTINVSDPTNLAVVGTTAATSGARSCLTGVGNYIFVADSIASVRSYDIADPTTPVLIDTLTDVTNFTTVNAMCIDNNWLYVCNSSTIFVVVDIQDPYNMTVSGSLSDASITGVTNSINARGNYVYVGCTNSILVIDVSDKTTPTIAATLTDASVFDSVRGICFAGDTLYVSSSIDSTVVTIDISDPTSPSIVGSVATSVATTLRFSAIQGRYIYVLAPTRIFVFETPWAYLGSTEIGNLQVSGDTYMFGTLTTGGRSNFPSGLEAGHISSTGGLGVLGAVNIQGTLTTGQNYLHIENSSGVLNIDYTATQFNYRSDISLLFQSTNTTGTTFIRTGTDTTATSVEFQNNSGDTTLSLLGNGRITHNIVTNPVSVGTLTDGTNLPSPICLSVEGDYAYIGNSGSGLIASVDVSDPTSPALLDTFTAGGSFGRSEFMKARGKYLFTTTYTSDDFWIFNIEDPNNLATEGSLTDATNLNEARGFDIQGNHAFIGCAGLLTSVDISDPTTPAVNSTVALTNGAYNVVVIGIYAYCLSRTNTFYIVNISDPSSMTLTGTLTDGTNIPNNFALAVRGKYAYVGTNAGRFIVIDVSNKSTPTIVGNLLDATNLNVLFSMSVSGNYAYCSCTTGNTLTTVDISDPTTPTIVGAFALSTTSTQTSVIQGRYAYVIGNTSTNLQIIELNGVQLTSTEIGNLEVTGDTYMTNNLLVEGYVNVATGMQVNNSMAVLSDMTVHDNLFVKGTLFPTKIGVKNRSFSVGMPNGSVVTETFVGKVVLDTGIVIMENPLITTESNIFLTVIGSGDARLLFIDQGSCQIQVQGEQVVVQYMII